MSVYNSTFDYKRLPYYYFSLTESETFSLLQNPGDFLVQSVDSCKTLKKNESIENVLVLSVRCENGRSTKVRHWLIKQAGRLFGIEKPQFFSIGCMVDYYILTQKSIVVKEEILLNRPIYRLTIHNSRASQMNTLLNSLLEESSSSLSESLETDYFSSSDESNTEASVDDSQQSPWSFWPLFGTSNSNISSENVSDTTTSSSSSSSYRRSSFYGTGFYPSLSLIGTFNSNISSENEYETTSSSSSSFSGTRLYPTLPPMDISDSSSSTSESSASNEENSSITPFGISSNSSTSSGSSYNSNGNTHGLKRDLYDSMSENSTLDLSSTFMFKDSPIKNQISWPSHQMNDSIGNLSLNAPNFLEFVDLYSESHDNNTFSTVSKIILAAEALLADYKKFMMDLKQNNV